MVLKNLSYSSLSLSRNLYLTREFRVVEREGNFLNKVEQNESLWSYLVGVSETLEKIRQSAKRTKLATSKYFKDTFLIKHSCALSFEAAAGLATQTYIALEECGQAYTEVTGI